MVSRSKVDEALGVPLDSAGEQSRYRVKVRRGTRISLDPHPSSPDPTDRDSVRAWLDSRPRPWAIDLFCGAGGLSLGLFLVGAGHSWLERTTRQHHLHTHTHTQKTEKL